MKEVKVFNPCTVGMWSGGLLLTLSADMGVFNLWDGSNLAPLAEAYSTFQVTQNVGHWKVNSARQGRAKGIS